MKYADVSILELQDDCFEQLVQSSIDDLRLNCDETRAIIKWEGEMPSWLGNLGVVIRDAKEARRYYTVHNGW
jgi:hypothetical protein